MLSLEDRDGSGRGHHCIGPVDSWVTNRPGKVTDGGYDHHKGRRGEGNQSLTEMQ